MDIQFQQHFYLVELCKCYIYKYKSKLKIQNFLRTNGIFQMFGQSTVLSLGHKDLGTLFQ